MEEIKDLDAVKIAGGKKERDALLKQLNFGECKPREVKYENRECVCIICGEKFEESYPVRSSDQPLALGYMYWGKGLYCRKCWPIAHAEMGKK